MVRLRIKDVLLLKGLSQKDLYESVGLSQVYVSEIIRGIKLPKIETLEQIATFLDVDIRDLFEPTKEGGERYYIEEGTGKRIKIIDL